jgi:hypothetical protein
MEKVFDMDVTIVQQAGMLTLQCGKWQRNIVNKFEAVANIELIPTSSSD